MSQFWLPELRENAFLLFCAPRFVALHYGSRGQCDFSVDPSKSLALLLLNVLQGKMGLEHRFIPQMCVGHPWCGQPWLPCRKPETGMPGPMKLA